MKAPTKEQLLADVLSNATWNEIAQNTATRTLAFSENLPAGMTFPNVGLS